MKLEKGLFELTKEQEETSKMLYNGKIIKCLVAPYHIYDDPKFSNPNFVSNKIEMEWADNVYMFPEKEMSEGQSRKFMSLVTSGKHQEVLIITASQSIILDMYDGCVRILTEFDTIVDCPEKIFGANIHTINISILNNKSHQKDKNSSYGNNFYVNSINDVISKVRGKDEFTQKEHDEIMKSIGRIGEPLVRDKLKSMMWGKKITDKDKNSEIERLENELKRLKNLIK